MGVLAFGFIVGGIAFVAFIALVARPFGRLMALGWLYIAMSIVGTGAALIGLSGLSRSGDPTILLIGLLPLLLIVVVSFRLIRAASKAFRQAQDTRDIAQR